ncbi:MAG: D-alanine--D-alanine ligase [Nitrospinae bacterium CG11_big_fil_rev_8_21_14_0_20_56_8]|nr:MAG: D-alanine--D-alanine ligase [Nitrospinae bacterium CG11_big_fil_rev_8_21_14_0_20_56_8]
MKNGKDRIRTLGPVYNLEEHVASDWWGRIFNSLYLKTDSDVVDDQKITHSEIDQVIGILKLSPQDKILDLCCGQGRHSLEFARRGFLNVTGFDRSHYLIQKAKDRSRSEGIGVKFREGDARKLPFASDTFDAVLILGNSFGYFESLQDDLKVLKEMRRVLKPWGRILLDIADGEFLKRNFQTRSWEWLDNDLFVCRERSLSLDGDRLVSREVVTQVEKGVIADQFYAERLYTQESISRLLAEAKFSSVTFPGQVTPNSQRAQDLGMMEKRILTTAVVRKDWTPLRARRKRVQKHVAVVLGDPKKPDALKPFQIFDDDDFYTIDQMKAALKENSDYRFTYLHNHDTLVRDLMSLAGQVDYVFNLCDEGLNNMPLRELHIPALLESLGLPYTGSGPQCLAFCYDKSLVRGVAREMGIPIPKAFFIKPEDLQFELPFEFPVLVKPNFGDSSFGITMRSYAETPEELINAVQEIRGKLGYEKPLLVEEFLTGADLSVGIMGNTPNSYSVLPIVEEDYSDLPPELPRICGYEAKWCPDSPYRQLRSKPACLPADVEKALVTWCIQISERLGCRDYARFDWRVDKEGTPRLLEVNPNPGWCWDGHLAKMGAHSGMSYPELLRAILQASEDRLFPDHEEVKKGVELSEVPALAI